MSSVWNDDDDHGLPDEAFTEDELAAGVQHIMRTGDPNATSSGRASWLVGTVVDEADDECAEDANDVLSSHRAVPLRFETFAQARAWSQANPGKVFTRAANGRGFEAKPAWRSQSVTPPENNSISPSMSSFQRTKEIKSMAPQLEDVLSKSKGSPYRVYMRPFYRSTWEGELRRLNIVQLSRLRLLVTIHLEKSRNFLSLAEGSVQIYRSMIPNHNGEPLKRALNEFMEEVIKDIDKHLTARHGDDWDVPF